METTELRKKVIAFAKEADERALRIVNAVFENYGAEEIVAYSIDGEPLSKEDYVKSIKAADASIDAGDFTSVEDLEKEVQDW